MGPYYDSGLKGSLWIPRRIKHDNPPLPGFQVGREGRHIDRDIQCNWERAGQTQGALCVVGASERVPGPEGGGRMELAGGVQQLAMSLVGGRMMN